MVNMSAIEVVNDMVGGVTVTIEEQIIDLIATRMEIADELAKKGNAQALLMLGDINSPKQPQRGTIQKDTDMAGDCYKKALAAGAAEAQQRLDALK